MQETAGIFILEPESYQVPRREQDSLQNDGLRKGRAIAASCHTQPGGFLMTTVAIEESFLDLTKEGQANQEEWVFSAQRYLPGYPWS